MTTPCVDLHWIEERLAWVWSQSEFDVTGYAQSGSFIVPLSEVARTFGISIEEVFDLTYGRAAQFLAELETPFPVEPAWEAKPLAGFIHADPNASIILVKRGANVARHHVARRRFTVAHELGHFVLHFSPLWAELGDDEKPVLIEGIHAPLEDKEMDETLFSSDLSLERITKSYYQLEAEANAFAARLLMPEWAVNGLFEKWAPRLSERRSVLARRFCGEFLVSLPAMRRRLDDLNLGLNDPNTSWRGGGA